MALDPQLADLLDSINALTPRPAGTIIKVEDARQRLDELFTSLAGESPDDCSSSDQLILCAHGKSVPARLYRPVGGENKALPAVIFFHGGGWSLGGIAAYDTLMRTLCVLSGVVFISVDYRLAPEHKFPAGLEDALAVTRHVLENAAAFGALPSRIGVMGDSAGGNLAAVVAQRMMHENASLAAQFLLYPSLDLGAAHERYPSRMRFGDGDFMLSREGIDSAIAWYHDSKTDLNDPCLSPVNEKDLAGLPPCLLMVGSHDPLRDETRLYAQRLEGAGVSTGLIEVPGAIHAFLSFGVLDIAQQHRIVLAQKIRQLLCA